MLSRSNLYSLPVILTCAKTTPYSNPLSQVKQLCAVTLIYSADTPMGGEITIGDHPENVKAALRSASTMLLQAVVICTTVIYYYNSLKYDIL